MMARSDVPASGPTGGSINFEDFAAYAQLNENPRDLFNKDDPVAPFHPQFLQPWALLVG